LVTVYQSRLDVESAKFAANCAETLARLAEVDAALARARAGGGERYMARHKARGKLLARERIVTVRLRTIPRRKGVPHAASGDSSRNGLSRSRSRSNSRGDS
jgi:hypothetical protein